MGGNIDDMMSLQLAATPQGLGDVPRIDEIAGLLAIAKNSDTLPCRQQLAKNANNEYGPLVKQEFSTPAVETEEGEEPEGGETDGETGGETEPSGIQRRAIRK